MLNDFTCRTIHWRFNQHFLHYYQKPIHITKYHNIYIGYVLYYKRSKGNLISKRGNLFQRVPFMYPHVIWDLEYQQFKANVKSFPWFFSLYIAQDLFEVECYMAKGKRQFTGYARMITLNTRFGNTVMIGEHLLGSRFHNWRVGEKKSVEYNLYPTNGIQSGCGWFATILLAGLFVDFNVRTGWIMRCTSSEWKYRVARD